MFRGEEKLSPPVLAALKAHGFRPASKGQWQHEGHRWKVALRVAPQSWGRLLAPLLSQSILEARAQSGDAVARPLAVLFAPIVSDTMHDRLHAFVNEVAPKDAWAVIDGHGRSWFHVPGVKALPVPNSPVVSAPRRSVQTNLFSDLNQWLLKVLLAPALPENLVTAPRQPIRNASVLAGLAKVSVPVAARFVKALDTGGHLDRRFGDLRVADAERLLLSWRAAAGHSRHQEFAMQHARGAIDDNSFRMMLQMAKDGERSDQLHHGGSMLMTAALFSACERLGLRHVDGGARHVYVEKVMATQLEARGLVPAAPGARVDLMIRVARFPEAIQRASVIRDGVRTTDVIQCWLDVSHHRARGEEQADFLWRKILRPALVTS